MPEEKDKIKKLYDTLLGSVLQGHVVPEVNNDGYDIEDLALLLKVLKQKRVEVM